MWLCLCIDPVRAQLPANAASDELQLLVDVSGSMKQNDPANLRVDATKLWLNLLPEGQRAGLWLFAENTRLLTENDHVDATWKQHASAASAKIDSRGRYTDIELAIKTLLGERFQGEGPKHLMLMTDGRVDISPDIMVSADSRERILSEQIPELKRRHIQVHTIALSAQADAELLKSLAYETDGWSERAESAEQLQRLFLKMLQQAAPRDHLPLRDNRFQVDASVQEFSVVVFKAPKAPATRLFAPNQQVIDRQSPGISWLETEGYDLITIKHPQSGDWRIDAATDPDNQVMILTDLKLAIEPLPQSLKAQQALPIKAHLSEQGQPIVREDFLSLVQWALVVDQQTPTPLHAIPGESGFFMQSLTGLSPGKHRLTLRVDGKTFQREQSREIDVQATPVGFLGHIAPGTRDIELQFTPDPALLDIASLSITVMVNAEGQAPGQYPVTEQQGVWRLTLPPWPPVANGTLTFDVKAKTLEGQMLDVDLPPWPVDESRFEPAANALAGPEQPATDHESAEPTADEKNAESSWGTIIALVLGLNVLVGGGGWWLFRRMRRSEQAKQQQILEKLQ